MPRRRNENVFIYPYGIVDEPTKELGLGVRHFQALLMCLCLLMATCIMSMYSVTINAMYKDGSASLEWSIHKIKASFFVGYVMAQIPACIFANKFGGKILVAISIFLSGVLNISIPLGISSGGWIAFQMMRLLQGLCIGCVLPSVNTLLGQWAPANERTRLTYLVYGGIPMGVILAELVSKYLIDSSFGWPSSFYLFGVVCSFMGCIWWYLGYDTPNKHKFISREEKEYINESLGKETCNEGSNELPRSKMIIPWWSMATSVPVWTYCVTLTGTTTSFLIFLVKIPRFFIEVYGMPWSQNIFLMVLPYVLIWITGICLASLSDHLVRKNIMSISDVRRVSNTIGTVCPATCLLILCVIPPNFALLLTIAFIIIGLFGAVNTGIMINNIDLTPNFAGLIYGISNKIAITTAFTVIAILDLFSGLTVHSYWKMMFYSLGSINIFSNLLFLICGSAERQTWDNPIYILQTRQEPKP